MNNNSKIWRPWSSNYRVDFSSIIIRSGPAQLTLICGSHRRKWGVHISSTSFLISCYIKGLISASQSNDTELQKWRVQIHATSQISSQTLPHLLEYQLSKLWPLQSSWSDAYLSQQPAWNSNNDHYVMSEVWFSFQWVPLPISIRNINSCDMTWNSYYSKHYGEETKTRICCYIKCGGFEPLRNWKKKMN